MKRMMTLVVLFALLLSLCACGASPAAQPAAEKERPAGMESVLPGASQKNESAELARALIGEPVERLYEKLGEPLSADYAPSCLGSGEDGELVYDGFTVFTYREAGVETVQDVEG